MTPLKACHNCRRSRLKCDRSLPQCLKCSKRGQECLGYQRLFRWEQGVASRGKMAGITFEMMAKDQSSPESQVSLSPSIQSSDSSSCEGTESPPSVSLLDPVIQDLTSLSRKYLFHFASHVCRDLVLYDTPKHNPFRELIPLTHQYPVLLHTIVANSALHMSNSFHKSLLPGTSDSFQNQRTSMWTLSSSKLPQFQQLQSHSDALAAKQKALGLLKSALGCTATMNVDVTLAVVLLLIEFELIDSGQDTWRHHINGARTIIETLCGPKMTAQQTLSPLRSCLIANCLVFDIVGSTLSCPETCESDEKLSYGALSLLQDAEGNHCSSFPTILLQLMREGAKLYRSKDFWTPADSPADDRAAKAQDLLHRAQSFDPTAWATSLQRRSPATDLRLRMHVASAHRAAVCIYLSRVLLSLGPDDELLQKPEALVTDIITNLSYIRPNDALFTATTWPTFIAGAETSDCAKQDWVAKRFHELWEVEPWGLIRGALEVLERMWKKRRRDKICDEGLRKAPTNPKEDGDWIAELRGNGVDWLIL